MKAQDFDKIIKELLFESGRFPTKEVVDIYLRSARRIEAAKLAAYSLWVAETPDDSRTEVLRKQLIHLESESVFNFTGD